MTTLTSNTARISALVRAGEGDDYEVTAKYNLNATFGGKAEVERLVLDIEAHYPEVTVTHRQAGGWWRSTHYIEVFGTATNVLPVARVMASLL